MFHWIGTKNWNRITWGSPATVSIGKEVDNCIRWDDWFQPQRDLLGSLRHSGDRDKHVWNSESFLGHRVNSMTTGRIVQPNNGRGALKPKPFGNETLATLSDKELWPFKVLDENKENRWFSSGRGSSDNKLYLNDLSHKV